MATRPDAPDERPEPDALLAELRKLDTTMTPGPWWPDQGRMSDRWFVKSGAYCDEEPVVCGTHSKAWPLTEADADGIAKLRTLLPALIRRLEEQDRPPGCGTCGGVPPVSGLACVCGGANTVYAEVQGLREECAERDQQVEALHLLLAEANRRLEGQAAAEQWIVDLNSECLKWARKAGEVEQQLAALTAERDQLATDLEMASAHAQEGQDAAARYLERAERAEARLARVVAMVVEWSARQASFADEAATPADRACFVHAAGVLRDLAKALADTEAPR